MTKYVANTRIWNRELEQYFDPGEEFEASDGADYKMLTDLGVISMIPVKSTKKQAVEQQGDTDGSDN